MIKKVRFFKIVASFCDTSIPPFLFSFAFCFIWLAPQTSPSCCGKASGCPDGFPFFDRGQRKFGIRSKFAANFEIKLNFFLSGSEKVFDRFPPFFWPRISRFCQRFMWIFLFSTERLPILKTNKFYADKKIRSKFGPL